MKAKKAQEIADVKLVHLQTGYSEKNINQTYRGNPDKQKVYEVMVLGSMCTEKEITKGELEIALEYTLRMRLEHGS